MKIQQRLLTACFATVSIATIGGVRSIADAALAPESGVQLYSEAHYSGTRLLFSPGKTYSVTLDPEYRNKISSLQVPDGFKVTLVDRDGRQSRSHTFGAGNHPVIEAGMNNRADRIIVSTE
ncbi:MAG: hypothetical protein WBB01_26520 [Phormidesmis sp.]